MAIIWTVKFYDPKKWFGFIIPNDGSKKEYFVFNKWIIDKHIKDKDEVCFDLVQSATGRKEKECINVKKI